MDCQKCGARHGDDALTPAGRNSIVVYTTSGLCQYCDPNPRACDLLEGENV